MQTEVHIEKLEKCDKGYFISAIFIIRRKYGSIKLALDSKMINDQVFENKISDA